MLLLLQLVWWILVKEMGAAWERVSVGVGALKDGGRR